MKSLPFIIATGASALSLLLGIWLFVLSGTNQGLQNQLQKLQQDVQSQQQTLQVKQQAFQAQQEQINTAQQISQQVGPALLRDMAVASIKNDKIKKILTSHGYNVELKDEGKDGKPASPSPAPAIPAPRPLNP
ncbi:MAG: hypothetical protein WCF18_24245 [Chthoniobacteraceae bacterium]